MAKQKKQADKPAPVKPPAAPPPVYYVHVTGNSSPVSEHGDYNKALRALEADPRGGYVSDEQNRVRYRKALDLKAMRQQVAKLRADAQEALGQTVELLSTAQRAVQPLLEKASSATKQADDIESWASHNGHSLA